MTLTIGTAIFFICAYTIILIDTRAIISSAIVIEAFFCGAFIVAGAFVPNIIIARLAAVLVQTAIDPLNWWFAWHRRAFWRAGQQRIT